MYPAEAISERMAVTDTVIPLGDGIRSLLQTDTSIFLSSYLVILKWHSDVRGTAHIALASSQRRDCDPRDCFLSTVRFSWEVE
jgi:hypothetical protein